MLKPLIVDPIIFLDIDGCLVTRRSIKEHDFATAPTQFDSECVWHLKELLHASKASVVISSTWRFIRNELDASWVHWGLPAFIGTTTMNHKGKIRGEQIQEWLDEHDLRAPYVILDDDSDMLESQTPFFIKTDMINGLTAAHVAKAISILGER